MGLAIDRSSFSEQEYEHAGARLRDNLAAMQALLARPGFGRGKPSLGAELEMSIVDSEGNPLPLNREVLADTLDPQLQLELDRFNLEYNLQPVAAAGRPFTAMKKELSAALDKIAAAARKFGGRVVPIGILPTLAADDLQSDAMTDLERYKALAAGIRRIRDEKFRIRIDGAEPLDTEFDSLTAEGANTSLQIHLRVNPEEFADYYNAAQLATPIALAVSANSPLFLGHRLWDETRIALFKQSVDSRGVWNYQWRRAARVPFGHGWIRRGALELFAESCHLYPVLIPLCSNESARDIVRAGGVPELAELRLHQGTIWNWNRAIYDDADGGHLRIELRALPSGPGPVDMMANAAFLVGMTAGLVKSVEMLLPAFPFRYAEYNFYRAAQKGLYAELLWPTLTGLSPQPVTAGELCRDMLPIADDGLELLGVDEEERKRLLGIIEARLDSGMTPANWQRIALARGAGLPREEALRRVVLEYLENLDSGAPVSEW